MTELLPVIVPLEDFASSITPDQASGLHGKRILITGATGMVGSYLTESIAFGLREYGLRAGRISILARSSHNPNLAAVRQLEEVEIQETNLTAWQPENHFDYVIHAASPASPTQYGDSAAIIDANVGFASLLASTPEAFGRVLFVSSGEVYGSNAPQPVPESYIGKIDGTLNRSVYPLSKLQAEEVLRDSKLDASSVRLFHSFGPGMRMDDGRSFADFIWAAARKENVVLRSPGTDIRSFLYLSDLSRGFLQVLLFGEGAFSYNLGSSDPVTIRQFAMEVAEIAGVDAEIPDVSASSDYEHSPNHRFVPDTTKLGEIGWKSEQSLQDGIRKTLHWVRQQLEG